MTLSEPVPKNWMKPVPEALLDSPWVMGTGGIASCASSASCFPLHDCSTHAQGMPCGVTRQSAWEQASISIRRRESERIVWGVNQLVMEHSFRITSL